MELRQFVAESLLSIIGGVEDAQAADTTASVNPSWESIGANVGVYPTNDGRIAFAVSFDVAVTVIEGGEKEGSGKITVATIANIGGKVTSTSKAETVTRLQFGIPIAFPEPKNSAARGQR
jgi:hypothetical protein